MLAGADEFDRHAGDLLDRQRRAAAGVAVELGHHQAVELQRFVERFGAVDGILAGHAVDHQQHLVGLDALVDSLQLLHQLVVDVQSAGGVENDHRNAFFGGFANGVVANGHGIGRAALGVHRQAELFADNVQLIDGRGALQVGGHEHHLAAALLNQPAELAARRGFAGALQAAQHQDAGRAGFEMERVIDRPHQVDELAVHDADQLLRGIERIAGPFRPPHRH